MPVDRCNYSKEIKGKWREHTETLYSCDVNIQDILEDVPYLQKCLVQEDEVRSALHSLPTQLTN